MAVIAAFELDDLRPARCSRARGAAPTSSPRCRTTRAARARATAAGGSASRRASISSSVGAPNDSPCARRRLHRCDDGRMRVAERSRAPRADVVDVALAVGVPQIRALAAREKARRAADRAKRAHRRVDAGRESSAARARTARRCGSSGSLLACRLVRRSHASIARAARVIAAAIVVGEHVGDHGERRPRPRRSARCALAAVMPPIATTGTPSVCARAQQRRCRRAARRGLVADAKKLPNAT